MAPPGCMEALWVAVKGNRRASAARFYRLRLLGASVASSRAPVSPSTPSSTAPPLFSEGEKLPGNHTSVHSHILKKW